MLTKELAEQIHAGTLVDHKSSAVAPTTIQVAGDSAPLPIVNGVNLPDFLTPDIFTSPLKADRFVARKAQLIQMMAFLDNACSGDGQVIFVTGQAGTGKSSLLREFARQAQAS